MYTVCAIYHFTRFEAPEALRPPLLALCREAHLTGTLILAQEGLNGTIAGSAAGIARLTEHLRALPGCADLRWSLSTAELRPFARMKVRIKREIVTMGQPEMGHDVRRGTRVSAQAWNALISAPDVAVIDTRNRYETAIGSFEGAVDPGTDSFRDFPAWWDANAHRFEGRRVAMFCTGGIRCEKSTAFLLERGVEQVYHLDGGILKYLETVAENESLWRGSCFVFDGRVSVRHGLAEGPHLLCHACRRPLHPDDRAHPDYEPGVACHHCAGETSPDDKTRFRERARQIALARARGARHLRADPAAEGTTARCTPPLRVGR